MRKENGEVHTQTDEARGGSTPRRMRWILLISTVAAIVLLSAVWMIGAASVDSTDSQINATRIEQSREVDRSSDAMLSDGFDEFGSETSSDVAREGDAPARTVPN